MQESQTRIGADVAETITLVTSNPNKVRALQGHTEPFGVHVVSQALTLVEPQADTIEEVALSKAGQAYKLLMQPVIVEDSGFGIDALSGFPGAYTKYVLQTIGVQGLLNVAQGLEARACRFTSALVHIDAGGTSHVFVDDAGVGTLAQTIDETPCADAWSDLWRVFVPHGADVPLTGLTTEARGAYLTEWQRNSVYTRFGKWFREQRVK